VVELFVFYQMKSDASRIEILEFSLETTKDTLPPPPRVLRPRSIRAAAGGSRRWISRFNVSIAPLQRRVSGTMSRLYDRNSPVFPTNAERMDAPFDVRHASCVMVEDQHRLLAVIEMCGSGFDSFNAWMQELLAAQQTRRTREAPHRWWPAAPGGA
jgi:hypothetical protein